MKYIKILLALMVVTISTRNHAFYRTVTAAKNFINQTVSQLFNEIQSILFTPNHMPAHQKNDFELLLKNCELFKKNISQFPKTTNTPETIAARNHNKQQQIIAFAKETYPLIDDSVIQLCEAFIAFKKDNGSTVEKEFYENMTLPQFIIRCLTKRPLAFLNYTDDARLRNNQNPTKKSMDFTQIGTDQEKDPLILKDYLSYDEIKISALIGLSGPTFFINNGSRNNNAQPDIPNTFQQNGVYAGLVGARFEKPNYMEWQDIIITETQNTSQNGYGLDKCNEGLLKIWSDVYDQKFPTYQEAKSDTSDAYVKFQNNTLFNRSAFKKRIELVVKPFLVDANKRGKEQNKKVYVHTVGLGLGAWAISPIEQTKCTIEVYKEIIKSSTFAYISDIDFSWFGENSNLLVPGMNNNSACTDQTNNPIIIHFSQRNPADKLTGKHTDKLLVACYAWDGNAYPGNEYWVNMFTATGDPAAACCSLITTLQNILINPWLKDTIIRMYNN